MSNQLMITVGMFKSLDEDAEGFSVMVIAQDGYGKDFREYDDVESFLQECPTEHDLIMMVLQWDAFCDGAVVNETNNSFELDSISSIDVCGFPETVGD